MSADRAPPWFSEEAGFFGPWYLAEYAQLLPAQRSLQEVDFIERVLALQPGARILDVPCGHGRHAVELAGRGYAVTGTDINGFFLEQAGATAAGQGVTLSLQQGDMRALAFDAEFDVVLNLFSSIGYFEDDADDQKVFDGIARALVPGGQFFIDFLNREALLRNFKPTELRELPDGTTLLFEREHDLLTGKNIVRRTVTQPGGKPRRIADVAPRQYTTVEIIKMAKAAGLAFRQAWGDFEGGPLTIDSARVLLVFGKV
ncbi:MAG TPA: class I SAM-dependent methyltransferase [Ramlibacter sp.]|nr:class I SAM-dependent methyltransferase [Ramlibacter sp.]